MTDSSSSLCIHFRRINLNFCVLQESTIRAHLQAWALRWRLVPSGGWTSALTSNTHSDDQHCFPVCVQQDLRDRLLRFEMLELLIGHYRSAAASAVGMPPLTEPLHRTRVPNSFLHGTTRPGRSSSCFRCFIKNDITLKHPDSQHESRLGLYLNTVSLFLTVGDVYMEMNSSGSHL